MAEKVQPGFRTWSFRLDEVDQQIADVDACDSLNLRQVPIFAGPFSVFHAREHLEVGFTSKETPATRIHVSRRSDTCPLSEIPDADCSPSGPSSADWLLPITSLAREAVAPLVELSPRIFQDQDPIIDHLMDNYVRNVAIVLAPLPHPENTYSTIYIPKAMTGASNVLFGLSHPASEMLSSNVAIFYALLATSAFHLRGSDPEDSEFDVIARGFRAKAFASLRKALQQTFETDEEQALVVPSTALSTHFEAVISAMLTLITMDVSSDISNVTILFY